jgi:hypothetical protein
LGFAPYLVSFEEERVPDVEVGLDGQRVDEDAEEPVEGEQQRVHPVGLEVGALEESILRISFGRLIKSLRRVEYTFMRLRSQRPLHVKGDAGHLVDRVVDNKRIIIKHGGSWRSRGTRGR